MSDERIVKKVFLGKPDGRRKNGRQKLSGLDCTENWWTKDGGREQKTSAWAIILKKILVKIEGPYANE
jgi:hypothetical protein